MSYDKEYYQQTRAFLKSRGRCTACGKKDAYTMIGKTRCCECAEKAAKYNTERYETKRGEVLKEKSDKYQQRKRAGLCVQCGKPAKEGRVRCQSCLGKCQRNMARYRERRSEEGMVSLWAGVCRHCGKPIGDAGEYHCPDCREKKIDYLRIARSRQKRNEYWEKDNLIAFQKRSVS